MKHLLHALEGFAVAALAQAPAILSSKAVQDFVKTHPADAALIPVAAGVLSMAYRWLKPKAAAPVVVTPIVAPPTPPATP
jgi:hypothetical protein